MTRQRAKLDQSRSYSAVYGDASYSYKQDGKRFDHQGLEIISDEAEEGPARLEPKAATRQQAPSSAAERMRRTRQRRRAGIVAVVSVEIRQEVVDWLVARNLISPEEIDDRKKIATAVSRVLEGLRRA